MDVLEEYEILSIIGEGTFGVVKLAKIKKTGNKVAIKILEKKKIMNEEDEERVDREIDILRRIRHINVIRIIKIQEDEENIYIIMEFCEKGELFNHIVEQQRLDEVESSYYYYQLINGLECLHYNEIVHRDLKPENLLLSKGYILKIIDFGLSNYFNNTKLLSTPCGSPCYASPEMVSGKKYNGFLIDIWSTGIILYAMLCGYLPFEDPDNDILFQKISNCEPEFPEELSKDAVDLMKKIMVNDPAKRITIPDIKKHPFYLKGKRNFESAHPDLVSEVEIDYSNFDNNNNYYKLENEDENKYEIKENIFRRKEKREYNPLRDIINEIQNENSYPDNIYIYRHSISQIFDEKKIIEGFQEKIYNKNINIKKKNYNDKEKNNNDNDNDNDVINIQINDILNDNINDKINDNNNNYNKKNEKNIKKDNININVNGNVSENINDKFIINNINDINKEKIVNKIIDNKNESNNNYKINEDFKKNENNNILNEINYKTESNINLNIKNKDINNFNPESDLNINKQNININNDILNIKNINDNLNDKIDIKDINEKKEINQNENNRFNKNNYVGDNPLNMNKNDNIMKQINNNLSKIKQMKEQKQTNDRVKKKDINKNNDENYDINILEKENNLEKKINNKKINNIVNINNNKNINEMMNSAIPHFISSSNKNRKNINDILQKNNYVLNTQIDENKKYINIKIPIDITYSGKPQNILNNNINNILKEGIKQKNSNKNSISNLKNKTYVEKKRPKARHSQSINPKPISKKREPISNKNNELKRDKAPLSIRTGQSLINKNNQMITFKLTELDSNSRKENININSAKNNPLVTFNTLSKPLNEVHSRKKNKIPTSSYNNENIKKKILGQNKTLYNNIQNLNFNSKKDNLSFNIINLNNNIYPIADPISTFSNSIDKIHNLSNFNNINSIQNNSRMNNHVITNYSQKNRKTNILIQNRIKISDNNITNSLQRNTNTNTYTNTNTNTNNNIQNNNNSNNNNRYNQNTYNKSINDNNINNSENLSTLPNSSLYSDIIYKRKFYPDLNNYSNLNNNNNNLMSNNNNKKNNILRQYNNFNNYRTSEKYVNDEINTIDRDEMNSNNSNQKQNINFLHKKDISNHLYPSNTEKKPEIYNNKIKNMNININKNVINSPSKGNKDILNQNGYIDYRKNHNYYVTSNKGVNYLPNTSNILPKKKLDLITENDNYDYLNNNSALNKRINANINPKRSRQNMNKLLGLISNSAEKYRTNNYPMNYTTSNIDFPVNLYSSQHHLNNFENNNNINQRRNNQIYINNNSYDNSDEYQRRNNNNNYYTNINKINDINNISKIKTKNNYVIQYDTNHKLVKKGILENSQKSKINNNINILDAKDNNIYDNRNKPNYKYSSNYNANNNINSGNENNYPHFNKTQGDLLYNKKVNLDKIPNNNKNYKIKNNMNMNININNNKRNENQINNEKRIDNRKIVRDEANRDYNQDNIYINNIKNNYSNTINNNNRNINNQNKNRYIQISSSGSNSKRFNKPILKTTDKQIVNLISSQIKKVPNNDKRNKNLENINFIKTNRNDAKLINKNKPISYKTQDFTSQISDNYLANNNINNNFSHIKSNISDTLIRNPLDKNLIKSRKTVDNQYRRTVNYDNNYNVNFNNNNYSNNNRNIKINL